jgi:hypothetical protein
MWPLPGIRNVAHLEGASSNSWGSEGVIKGESKHLVSSRDPRKSGNVSPYIREGDRWEGAYLGTLADNMRIYINDGGDGRMTAVQPYMRVSVIITG